MQTHFGFITATYTVIKKTAKEPRVVDGKCVRNYNEQVLVDLGEGFVLSSQELGILKPATGCQP